MLSTQAGPRVLLDLVRSPATNPVVANITEQVGDTVNNTYIKIPQFISFELV